MNSQASRFDVCVVCAMEEEAKGFLTQLEYYSLRPISSAISHRQRGYRQAIILNALGEEIAVQVSWPPRYGSHETSLHLQDILSEFQPRFAAMAGICAGDRRAVKLGDIIVAERAFFYDSGKLVTDAQGQQIHLHDVLTAQPSNDILQFVRMFSGWEAVIETLERPASKRQQREWLLNELYKSTNIRVDDIPVVLLETYAPAWRKIVKELQTGPDALLTLSRTLCSRERVFEMQFQDIFPFKDSPKPSVHIKPIGSGQAVRADNPFDEVQVPVRGAVAIDMEGASFYHTLANFPTIQSLLVKGVCDYADSDKDDSYHTYAAEASALYLLTLIKEYVTSRRNLQAAENRTPSEPANTQKAAPTRIANNSIGTINAKTAHVMQTEHIVINQSYDASAAPRKRKKLQS